MTITSPQLAALSAEIAALANSAATSLVAITHKHRRLSGFYWRPDVVVSVSEALDAQRDDMVDVHTAAGDKIHGTVLGHDPGTDVVLLRVPAAGPVLPVTASNGVQLGQAVVAAGRTPQGPTAALGFATLVGPAWRSMRGGDLSQRVLLDARIPRAAEGSAVLDTAGSLLGMAVFGPRRRVVLIPAETVERSATELLAHGRIRHGYLGVSVQTVAMPATGGGDPKSYGLMVLGLDDKGPAATAGILRGDILTAVDGKAPHSARALARMLPGSMIGQAKPVDLVRAGQATQVMVTIGDRPAK